MLNWGKVACVEMSWRFGLNPCAAGHSMQYLSPSPTLRSAEPQSLSTQTCLGNAVLCCNISPCERRADRAIWVGAGVWRAQGEAQPGTARRCHGQHHGAARRRRHGRGRRPSLCAPPQGRLPVSPLSLPIRLLSSAFRVHMSPCQGHMGMGASQCSSMRTCSRAPPCELFCP